MHIIICLTAKHITVCFTVIYYSLSSCQTSLSYCITFHGDSNQTHQIVLLPHTSQSFLMSHRHTQQFGIMPHTSVFPNVTHSLAYCHRHHSWSYCLTHRCLAFTHINCHTFTQQFVLLLSQFVILPHTLQFVLIPFTTQCSTVTHISLSYCHTHSSQFC